jgi:succinate dehydrogenase / fumarate reductase, membrane anchor subunit
MISGEVDKRAIANPATHYGSGKAATRSFFVQRLTAALNVLLTLFLVWFVVQLAGADRAGMVALVRNPLVAFALVVLLINVAVHMRIGLREIIEDYVHDPRLNRFSLMLNTFFALAIGLLGLGAVLKIVIWG